MLKIEDVEKRRKKEKKRVQKSIGKNNQYSFEYSFINWNIILLTQKKWFENHGRL